MFSGMGIPEVVTAVIIGMVTVGLVLLWRGRSR